MGVGILALLCAAAAFSGPCLPDGPFVGGEVMATLPDSSLGGRALAGEFFRALEEKAIPLMPGPVVIEASFPDGASGEGERALCGMEAVFLNRGFHPGRAGRRPGRGRKDPVLYFQALPRKGGRVLLSLAAPTLEVGPFWVLVVRAPWVSGGCLPAGTFRVSGEWEGAPGEALASARARAEERLKRFLGGLFPWRPWKSAFLAKFPFGTMEIASFLQMRTTPEGKVWKGWVLWREDRRVVREAGRLLAKEDRRWLFRICLAVLAALAFWYGALRLDWATKGFFTFRIRALSLLAWAGACGVLFVMV